MGHIYCNQANIYFNYLANFKSAKKTLNKSKNLFKKGCSDEVIARHYAIWANIYRLEANYPLAIHNANSSIQFLSKLNGNISSNYSLKLEYGIYLTLSLIFNKISELPRIKYYLIKAEKIALKLNDGTLIINCLIHRGNYYTRVGKYMEAESCLINAIEKLKNSNDIYLLGNAMHKLGKVYFLQQQYETALTYFLESYKVLSNILPNYNFSYELVNIGDTYLLLDNLNQAKFHYDVALERNLKFEHKDSKIMCLEGLSKYFEKKDEYKKVLELRNEIDELKFKIQSEERVKKIMKLEEKYHLALKQKEIKYRIKKQRDTENILKLEEARNNTVKDIIGFLNRGIRKPVKNGKQLIDILQKNGMSKENKEKLIMEILGKFNQIDQFSNELQAMIKSDTKDGMGEKIDTSKIFSLLSKNLQGDEENESLDKIKNPKTYFIQEYVSNLAKSNEGKEELLIQNYRGNCVVLI